MNNNIPETAQIIPSDFVIVGGTGHLSVRKILPALFWRFIDKQIDNKSRIILCDKNKFSSLIILLLKPGKVLLNCNNLLKST